MSPRTTVTTNTATTKATAAPARTVPSVERPERVAQGTLEELRATGTAIDPMSGGRLVVDGDQAKATPAAVRYA